MSALQLAWFLLVGALFAGYAVLDGFDLGVGLLHPFQRDEAHRRRALHAIGPFWDGNEVWLLTGAGALFAAFPPVYACVFSGFYLALMLVLLGLILRAVAIELRHQVDDDAWRRLWDVAFSFGSALPALFFGVALGNVVGGLELDARGNYTGGFFALLDPYSLLVGLTGLSMFATHGALWLALRTDGEQQALARAWASKGSVVWLVLFLAASAWSLAAYVRGSLPLAAAAAAVALAGIVAARVWSRAGADGRAFLASSVAILALLGATGASLFPYLVPASNDSALGLTIAGASSSEYALTAMLIVACLGMPVVVAYTAWVYRLFGGKVEVPEGEY